MIGFNWKHSVFHVVLVLLCCTIKVVLGFNMQPEIRKLSKFGDSNESYWVMLYRETLFVSADFCRKIRFSFSPQAPFPGSEMVNRIITLLACRPSDLLMFLPIITGQYSSLTQCYVAYRNMSWSPRKVLKVSFDSLEEIPTIGLTLEMPVYFLGNL